MPRMMSNPSGSLSVTMLNVASPSISAEVSTSLPLTLPASAAFMSPGANGEGHLRHRGGLVEVLLATVGRVMHGHTDIL